MAIEIINAIRHHPDVKLSTRFAAIELAHAADRSGTVRMSYDKLKWKLGCCRRTAFRKIAALVDLGIIRKTVTWLGPRHCGINTYHFLIKFTVPSAHPYSSDKSVSRSRAKMSSTLPSLYEREKRDISVAEELQEDKKNLYWLTPDTDPYNACMEKIERLETLLRRGQDASTREPAAAPDNRAPVP